MRTVKTPPRWDMTVVYPGMHSQEFEEGFSRVVKDNNNLATLFDTHQIMKPASPPSLNGNTLQALETIIQRYNAVLEAMTTLSVYITCFVTTNSHDTLAQAKLSELQQSGVILSQLNARFTAWIGSLDIEALIERSSVAREHAFMLRKARVRAAHLMTPPEENLASELDLSSGTAWEKLHGDQTSQLTVALELDGKVQELPMSMVRNLAFEADRDLRRRAYEAELEGWKRVALPIAGALNSIKGEVNVLTRRRGWESPLEPSLLDNNTDPPPLDAMLTPAT